MRVFLFTLAVVAVAFLQISASQAARSTAPAALKTLLEQEGFGGAQLQRRLGNHLFATTIINGRRTALMIDTGAPRTLIDRGTVRHLGLSVKKTDVPVGGVWGWKPERYGVTQIDSLMMGNCTFLDVPITVADESHINQIRGPHLDGLFGAHEMTKFGVIIDCARQMIYVNPKGPNAATTQKLATFLSQRGFARIPMRWDRGHHLEIDAGINGHPTQLIVDTGASTTLLADQVAHASAISFLPLRLSVRDTTAGIIPINIGHVQELTLGSLQIHNAEVIVAHIVKEAGAGLLGEEYLSWNFAIVDVGGMNLYLRAPESALGKKR